MTRSLYKTLAIYLSAFLLLSVFASLPARADLVTTDQATLQASAHDAERARVKALLARPEIARKLETLGVLPKDAQDRVDALTDQEIASLAQKIDALPAGGLSDQNWLLVVIAVILVAILIAL